MTKKTIKIGIKISSLSLLILLTLPSCSTQKESQTTEKRAPASERDEAEIQKRCEKGEMYFCYRAGSYKEENGHTNQAKNLFSKACDGGVDLGCHYLGLILEQEGNLPEAKKLYSKACNMGLMAGCSSLGAFYEKKGNNKEAKKLYSKACFKGFDASCAQLCDLVDRSNSKNKDDGEFCRQRKMRISGYARGRKVHRDTDLIASPGYLKEESQGKIYVTGITVVLGNMDPDIIRVILRDNIPLFSNCYQLELDKNNVFSGKVKLEFTIGPSGSVTMASVKPSDSKIPQSVLSCLTNVLKDIKFPPPKGKHRLMSHRL